MSEIIKPLILDETGKAIVEALTQREMTKTRIAEINAAADAAKSGIETKTDEQVERITEVTALAEDVNQLKAENAELKGDLVKYDDTARPIFLGDGEGWHNTGVGSTIKVSKFSNTNRLSIVTARKGDRFRLRTITVGGWHIPYMILDENKTILEVPTGNDFNGIIEVTNDNSRYIAVNVVTSYIGLFEFYLINKSIAENTSAIAENTSAIALKIDDRFSKVTDVTNDTIGLFNYRNGLIDFQTNDDYHYTLINNVNEGDIFIATGVSWNNGSSYGFVSFLDSNNNIVEVIRDTVNKDRRYEDKVIIVPKGCNKFYVNGGKGLLQVHTAKKENIISKLENDISKLENDKIDKINNEISELKRDITTKISYHYEKGETIGEIKDGLFNINTKTIEHTGDIYRYIELDVNLLDNLFLTGVSHNNASAFPFVVFVDANGNVLDIIKGDSKDAKFIDYNIIIKNQDVKKLYINGSVTFIGAYKAKEVDVYERVDGAVSVAAWYNEKVAEAVIDEQKKNPFAWRSFDKGVVVFTFDDSLSDIDLVESLSEEYGVPVCFSSIPSKMNNVTTATGTNKKVHEVLTIAEEHGNEVLCHSSVALSETSTDEEIYANFVTNKKLLEEYGYSVRGIIEAGSGGGELSFDTKRSEKYLRVMYEYSDHYGRNLGMPQYDTGRTYINRNTQNNHNVVDACEINKTLLIFATHSITDESTSSINTSESILRDLMAYVKTKDVYLLTFKGVYDMFRSSELENKINQLLN